MPLRKSLQLYWSLFAAHRCHYCHIFVIEYKSIILVSTQDSDFKETNKNWKIVKFNVSHFFFPPEYFFLIIDTKQQFFIRKNGGSILFRWSRKKMNVSLIFSCSYGQKRENCTFASGWRIWSFLCMNKDSKMLEIFQFSRMESSYQLAFYVSIILIPSCFVQHCRIFMILTVLSDRGSWGKWCWAWELERLEINVGEVERKRERERKARRSLLETPSPGTRLTQSRVLHATIDRSRRKPIPVTYVRLYTRIHTRACIYIDQWVYV